jgi:soluble lytic murein transglycosylase-like protein
MASSVGVMQVVYAGHARRCGLSSWKDLCDPEVNIRCGASYVRYLIDRRSDPDNSRWYIADRKLRIRTAVKDYNGVGNTNWKYEAGVRSHYERRKGQVKMASNPARNRIPS